MKKLTAALCLLALLVSMLAACGTTAAPETTQATETTAAPTAEATTEAATEAPAKAASVRLGAMTGPTGIGMVKLFDDADQNAVYDIFKEKYKDVLTFEE